MKKGSLESARRWTKVAKVLLLILGLLFVAVTALLYGNDASLAAGAALPITGWVKGVQSMVAGLVGIVAVIMVIVGGFVYATSQGNPNQIGVARDMIVSAIAGVALFILASWLLGSNGISGFFPPITR